MPGRLEPPGQREQRPGATSEQAAPPARSGRPDGPGCDPQQEIFLARQIRARGLVAGLQPGQIAEKIHDECGPAAGTSWIRAHRLALGISLADVVAQVRAWYVSEGRAEPRFSETLPAPITNPSPGQARRSLSSVVFATITCPQVTLLANARSAVRASWKYS